MCKYEMLFCKSAAKVQKIFHLCHLLSCFLVVNVVKTCFLEICQGGMTAFMWFYSTIMP